MFPRFRTQQIETGLEVGYAVSLVDVNGDGQKDIVVVDSKRLIWYENPSWKLHTVISGGTKPDNVCLAPYDIDGDGQLDFVLGAGWNPANTKTGGTLQWLKRGKNIDDPWDMHPIDEEPTIHRIRMADIDGDGRPELVSGPLFGRSSSKDKNYMDAPVRITAYRIPKDPIKDRWQPEVLSEALHVVHNLWPMPAPGRKGMNILTASYEGVSLLAPTGSDGKWTQQHLGVGNQDNPKSNRGASEIKYGKLKNGRTYIATVEPWHGFQIVVYTEPTEPGKLWDRHVIDDNLRWGHAVWCADLDNDGDEELIIGVRDDPGAKDKVTGRRGVRIYEPLDGKGAKWAKQVIENGDVAVEDLAVTDLNNDGRPDIVAVGRQTHNARIYWNEGTKQLP